MDDVDDYVINEVIAQVMNDNDHLHHHHHTDFNIDDDVGNVLMMDTSLGSITTSQQQQEQATMFSDHPHYHHQQQQQQQQHQHHEMTASQTFHYNDEASDNRNVNNNSNNHSMTRMTTTNTATSNHNNNPNSSSSPTAGMNQRSTSQTSLGIFSSTVEQDRHNNNNDDDDVVDNVGIDDEYYDDYNNNNNAPEHHVGSFNKNVDEQQRQQNNNPSATIVAAASDNGNAISNGAPSVGENFHGGGGNQSVHQYDATIQGNLDSHNRDGKNNVKETQHQHELWVQQLEQGNHQAMQQSHQHLQTSSANLASTTNDDDSNNNNIVMNAPFDTFNSRDEFLGLASNLQAIENMHYQQHPQQSQQQQQQRQALTDEEYHSTEVDSRNNVGSVSQQQRQPSYNDAEEDIVHLLNDDGDDDSDEDKNENNDVDIVRDNFAPRPGIAGAGTSSSAGNNNTAGTKRPRPSSSLSNDHQQSIVVPGLSLVGYQQQPQPYQKQPPLPPQGSQAAEIARMYQQRRLGQVQQQIKRHRKDKAWEPVYLNLPPDYKPTWANPLPPPPRAPRSKVEKHFELSLLNVKEFTITGLPVTWDGRCSSVLGFRKVIKEVSRGHGKAVFERDKDPANSENVTTDGGKWRIPLGAYRALFSYLRSDPMCRVRGIDEDQLKIASLGKARLEKGYPTVNKIVSYGVPKGLASALAPFQRGGVEFCIEKEGRALIADDMGLGKTVQGIASMSVYHEEWPLLVLTPSSARYHWESEFQQWLGVDGPVNNPKNQGSMGMSNESKQNTTEMEGEGEDEDRDEVIQLEDFKDPLRLLKDSEIHVLTSGKEAVLPHKNTRVVICSYGLAPSLAESGKLFPGLFKCAIVDESHMLKNLKTKRTSKLVPVLAATNRCVLLSGTPALARPMELWPQLKILNTERDGWWDDEAEFIQKYVQKTSAVRRAELHTLLTGTVMIRRMKHDILKSLPSKQREKAVIDVTTSLMRQEFHKCMQVLRKGKGVMAKFARKSSALPTPLSTQVEEETMQALRAEYDDRLQGRLSDVVHALQTGSGANLTNEQTMAFLTDYKTQVESELNVWFQERVHELQNGLQQLQDEQDVDRKSVLNRMYSLTAKAKVPLVANMAKKWLDDPTKGKLCIFAHHIFVLDELEKEVGLSNATGSTTKFIRIDGSTSPKERQRQIKAFQTDPSIRIAVLGITAAGIAVTLTASSTVWFAELFWTPALMIQAEDRCHRIGQNAKVKCLYFVAAGTLDVLLWDLLEKKFQDLGEFVEGKQKMKIVVHNIYNSVKDLQSIFCGTEGDDDDDEDLKDDEDEDEDDEDGDDLIKLEGDLEQDITQLAQEEMIMISQGEDEDGGDAAKMDGEPETQKSRPQSGLGQTEDEAICLSDDEDEVPTKPASNAIVPMASTAPAERKDDGLAYDYSKPFNKCRLYSQRFEGSTIGINLIEEQGRFIIASTSHGSRKPSPGDVLISVNGTSVPLNIRMDDVIQFIKGQLDKGSVELVFMEDEDFFRYCQSVVIPKHIIMETEKAQVAMKMKAAAAKPPPVNDDGIIELLDDD